MDYEELKEGLEELESLLIEAKQKAKELARNSEGIFKGQLESYLIGHLDNFISNSSQPGSIETLREILEDYQEEE